MGCNCGKSTQAEMKFVYTAPDGSKTEYTSEVQARAAQIRNGNKGTYVTVPK